MELWLGLRITWGKDRWTTTFLVNKGMRRDDFQRIELITGTARRLRWTTEQQLRIIEAIYAPGVRFPRWRDGMGGAEPALSMAAPDGGGRRGSRGVG